MPRWSPLIDHGSKKFKTNEGIRFTFWTDPWDDPPGFLWWRDDQGAWSDHIDFTWMRRTLLNFAPWVNYRTREWKLVLDDIVPMTWWPVKRISLSGM